MGTSVRMDAASDKMAMAITYWNRVEPRPRAREIAGALAARVRDPLWMLTRQWQFGEFQGEDAGSPAFVKLRAHTAPLLGWRPAGQAGFAPIGAPLEELVETEGFTPDHTARVELGALFAAFLRERGVPAAAATAIEAAARRLYQLPPVPAVDRTGSAFAVVCAGRAIDGFALAVDPAALLADPSAAPRAAEVQGAVDDVKAEVAATFGALSTDDAPAWRRERLEYDVEVATGLPGGGTALLHADPDRDATFEWFAFDLLTAARERRNAGLPAPPAATEVTMSGLPAFVRFRGMPNHRWWDFERGASDFGGLTPDRRDLAKLIVMDFMLIHGNDYFAIPFDQEVGTVSRIEELLVHDVFGGVTLVERADRDVRGPRWTCFSTTIAGPNEGIADFFLLPPTAGSHRISGPTLEDVRFVRDEQANYVWAIEHGAEAADGALWLGHDRHVSEVATEPPLPAPATPSPLVYQLQTFVPWHWFPMLPVSLSAATGETVLERGRMVRPDGRTPGPIGRILAQRGVEPYRVREEAVPRTGVRVLREAARARWLTGDTHLWVARRTLPGRGEGSSGLRYDIARVAPAPPP